MVNHFLTKCPQNRTCSAVLAACNRLGSTIDIVLSHSRLHNIIVSSVITAWENLAIRNSNSRIVVL